MYRLGLMDVVSCAFTFRRDLHQLLIRSGGCISQEHTATSDRGPMSTQCAGPDWEQQFGPSRLQ